MVFVKSGVINGSSLPSLDDYYGTLNVLRASRTARFLLREQSAYTDQKLGAQKKLLNISVLFGGESDEKEEFCVRNLLLQF